MSTIFPLVLSFFGNSFFPVTFTEVQTHFNYVAQRHISYFFGKAPYSISVVSGRRLANSLLLLKRIQELLFVRGQYLDIWCITGSKVLYIQTDPGSLAYSGGGAWLAAINEPRRAPDAVRLKVLFFLVFRGQDKVLTDGRTAAFVGKTR